jgi:hypothetical protein
MIVGNKPGQQEIDERKSFGRAIGGVLRTELAKQKVDLNQIRLTNLWLHEPNNDSRCEDYGFQKFLKELPGKKVILVVGSDTVKRLCEVSVEGYNGLLVQSNWIPDAKLIACVRPEIAFHSGLGELRFALEQFAKYIKMEKLA